MICKSCGSTFVLATKGNIDLGCGLPIDGGTVSNDHPYLRMPELHEVTCMICTACINGEGGECHTPGCVLYLNRAPDVPLQLEATHPPGGTTDNHPTD